MFYNPESSLKVFVQHYIMMKKCQKSFQSNQTGHPIFRWVNMSPICNPLKLEYETKWPQCPSSHTHRSRLVLHIIKTGQDFPKLQVIFVRHQDCIYLLMLVWSSHGAHWNSTYLQEEDLWDSQAPQRTLRTPSSCSVFQNPPSPPGKRRQEN